MVGADSDSYRPRRSKPPALGSAPSALPRLETSLACGCRTLVEGLDDAPLSGRLRPAELNERSLCDEQIRFRAEGHHGRPAKATFGRAGLWCRRSPFPRGRDWVAGPAIPPSEYRLTVTERLFTAAELVGGSFSSNQGVGVGRVESSHINLSSLAARVLDRDLVSNARLELAPIAVAPELIRALDPDANSELSLALAHLGERTA